MPSSQDLSGGGHGHGRRGEEDKNGRGRETDLHTAAIVPPWHRHNGAKQTAERVEKMKI